MLSMYQATLPPSGIIDVRRAAAKLDGQEMRASGLSECRVYFPGTCILLRLESEGDPLGHLARGPTGAALLRSLEESAWFQALARRLDPIAEMGAPRANAHVSGVAILGVNSLHEAPLRRELHDVAPALANGPRVEVHEGPHEIVLYLEGASTDDIDAILHGDHGTALQRVLHDHTGYSERAWRTDFALDLASVQRGLISGGNFAPGMKLEWPEGLTSPVPHYDVPIGR